MTQIVLSWSIANSGTDIGSTRVEMRDGWPAFIDEFVTPGIEWARASDIEPAILLQHPFGLYSTDDDSDAMHLDGYDYAKAAGATWLTSDFSTATAWRSITAAEPRGLDVQCFGYHGGVHLTERLRTMPPADLAATIKRNLKPMVSAGFRGVYIDFAENAITHPFTHPTVSAQSMGRSRDSVLLEIADEMFTANAGIEAAPRNFSYFQLLWPRNVVLQDTVYQHRYGGMTPEEITAYAAYGYGDRHSEHVALGYDISVLTGNIWRTLGYLDDPTDTTALAQRIVSAGHLPVFNPRPFILNDVPASEVLG